MVNSWFAPRCLRQRRLSLCFTYILLICTVPQTALSTSQDLDGDGAGEVFAVLDEASPTSGDVQHILVIDGRTRVAIFDRTETDQTRFASRIAPVGDLTGDGFAEFAIARPRDSILTDSGGTVEFIDGADGSLLYRLYGSAHAFLGRGLARAPDLTGDGAQEVLFTMLVFDATGDAWGRLIAFDPVRREVVSVLQAEQAGDEFGAEATQLPDVDGDGIADVAISAPAYRFADSPGSTRRGRVYIVSTDALRPGVFTSVAYAAIGRIDNQTDNVAAFASSMLPGAPHAGVPSLVTMSLREADDDPSSHRFTRWNVSTLTSIDDLNATPARNATLVPGDIDASQHVDIDDMVLTIDATQTVGASSSLADINGDTLINAEDVAVVLANYGASGPIAGWVDVGPAALQTAILKTLQPAAPVPAHIAAGSTTTPPGHSPCGALCLSPPGGLDIAPPDDFNVDPDPGHSGPDLDDFLDLLDQWQMPDPRTPLDPPGPGDGDDDGLNPDDGGCDQPDLSGGPPIIICPPGVDPIDADLVDAELLIGDPSGSHSEAWSMTMGGVTIESPTGGVLRQRVRLCPGTYDVTLRWLRSCTNPRDPDYRADVIIDQATNPDQANRFQITYQDPEGLLGTRYDVDVDATEQKSARISIYPKLEFKIDEATHATETRDLMVLPGDSERVSVQWKDDPDAVWDVGQIIYRTSDESIVKFLVDGEIRNEITAQGPPEEIEVIGLAAGEAKLEAVLADQDDLVLGEIHAVVGGSIELAFVEAPSFRPVGGPQPVVFPDGQPGAVTPGRAGVSAERHAAIAAAAVDRRPVFRVAVKDADGNPKPNKGVAVASRDGLLVASTAGRSHGGGRAISPLFETDDRGYADIAIESSVGGIPADLSFIYEELAVIVGRDAEQFSAADAADIYDRQRFDQHTFGGSFLHYRIDLTGDVPTDDPHTAAALTVPIVNLYDLTHLEDLLEQDLYWIAGDESFTLSLFDPLTGEHILDTVSPDAFLLAAENLDGYWRLHAANNFENLLDSSLSSLSDDFAYTIDFSFDAGDEEWLGLGELKPVTVAAIAAEFGVGFVPIVPDLYDIFRYGLFENIDSDGVNPENYVIATIAFVGLLADAGYIGGGVPGIVGNAAVSAVKIVAKRVPPPVWKAVVRSAGSTRQGLEAFIKYLQAFPGRPSATNPPAVVSWMSQAATQQINQMRYVASLAASPLQITAASIGDFWGVLTRRKLFVEDDAAAGGAFLARIGRLEAADRLFDDFAEEIAERSLVHAKVIGERFGTPTGGLSENAVRGVGVANKALDQDQADRIMREWLAGTAIDEFNLDRILSLFNGLDGVEGLDRYVRSIHKDRNNVHILGTIFEGSIAHSIRRGELTDYGHIQRLAVDTAPGNNFTVDLQTSIFAIQAKRTDSTHFTPSMIKNGSGSVSGEPYIATLRAQALSLERQPMLVLNKPASGPLQNLCLQYEVEVRIVID